MAEPKQVANSKMVDNHNSEAQRSCCHNRKLPDLPYELIFKILGYAVDEFVISVIRESNCSKHVDPPSHSCCEVLAALAPWGHYHLDRAITTLEKQCDWPHTDFWTQYSELGDALEEMADSALEEDLNELLCTMSGASRLQAELRALETFIRGVQSDKLHNEMQERSTEFGDMKEENEELKGNEKRLKWKNKELTKKNKELLKEIEELRQQVQSL